MLRLKDNLTGEMLENFALFLYVSKADSGPLAQRMYVFQQARQRRSRSALQLAGIDGPRGWSSSRRTAGVAPSFTPQGYYELDPDRMYKHHVSGQWQTPMPYAMFFNWQTGRDADRPRDPQRDRRRHRAARQARQRRLRAAGAGECGAALQSDPHAVQRSRAALRL